jgi:hypothetical protein
MAVGFEQDGQTGTIKYNGTNILDVAEKVAMKGAALGYAQLNAGQKVVEEPATKGNANGIASLDGNSRVIEAVKAVQPVGASNTSGSIGVNSGKLEFGDGAAVRTVEQTNQKGANNGYAGLDGNGRVIQQVTLVQSIAPSTTAGAVGMNSGKLQFGDGAQVRTVEFTSNKDQPNGYVGTDGGNFLNRQRIPSFTGLLAKDFDPVSQLYVKNTITTLKTYTAGDGSHIMVTGFQLPAQGQGTLRPRILIKFHDNSSVFIENNSGAAISDNFQGVANFLMGDAAAGNAANNDGKRVVAVAFEVQNTDVNNDVTQDLGVFRIRAYVVPAGGGTITITPP